MSAMQVRLEIMQGIARLTLQRPDKLNSLTTLMHAQLREALTEVERRTDVRVLVLTGSGRGFCAGQDLADRAVAPDAAADAAPDLAASVERDYAPLVRRLRDLPVPVVCAVNGVAAGAGVSLAPACDLVLARRSARFILSFCRLGLLPGTGGTYFLPRLIGTARALGVALLGEPIDAQQAEDWGLIWRCIDDALFEQEVDDLLTRLARAPTLGLTHTRQAIHAAAGRSLPAQLEHEAAAMRVLGRSQDYREGVAAFLERREPHFHGH